jgi:hypothetical protein
MFPGKKNPWILGINEDCKQPIGWPKTASWKRHKSRCKRAFDFADRWLAGDIPDPLPDADHYAACSMGYRAKKAGWRKLETEYKNCYYSMKKEK